MINFKVFELARLLAGNVVVNLYNRDNRFIAAYLAEELSKEEYADYVSSFELVGGNTFKMVIV